MKKVTLFLITFTILTNESYASFPISNELMINQNVVNEESLDDYHLKLQKTRFDVQSFKCEGCISKENTLKNNTSTTKLFLTSVILFVLSLITFAISMVDTIECINRPETCNQSGVPFLASSLVLFWSSILCFIMGVKANKKK
jgi:heme/copper-type cytochrome/quinol oxidase subunit 3